MSDFNSENNRAVWFDIPVTDLERAAKFYEAVLDVGVHVDTYEDCSFGVLEHKDGNGGCLIPQEGEIASEGGILIYMNVNGRIHDAIEKVTANGGTVVEPIHAIGPHGFRAIILDSEGGRMALHSTVDA